MDLGALVDVDFCLLLAFSSLFLSCTRATEALRVEGAKRSWSPPDKGLEVMRENRNGSRDYSGATVLLTFVAIAASIRRHERADDFSAARRSATVDEDLSIIRKLVVEQLSCVIR